MTYLDHAATTPMLPEAVAAMSAALARTGNASSLHSAGRAARRLVEEPRESIAAGLGARPSDVVFTGGGSEGDNQAVKGIYWARRAADPRRTRVLVSATEHYAVSEAGEWLAMVPDAVLNGDRGDQLIDGGPSRLPGNAHLSFPGCEGDSLIMLMDAQGIECSTGSACTAGMARPSHVLLAMGADEAVARGSLRFSLGHTSTPADVAAVARVIGPVVERARRAGYARCRQAVSAAGSTGGR